MRESRLPTISVVPDGMPGGPSRKLLCFAFLLAAAVSLGAREIFVAPDGSDRNPGTIAQPLGTLEGARDAIRAARIVPGAAANEPFAVWLRAGTYPLARTFEL